MINNPTGIVDKIKLVTSFPDMLVRFSVVVKRMFIKNTTSFEKEFAERCMAWRDWF